MKLEISAISENEAFARNAVAACALSLDPTLAELSDIKTAVSEAVTNSVVHAYTNDTKKEEAKIIIECEAQKLDIGGILHITITDFGQGIENVQQALLPFFTTLQEEERSGMGFTIMQTFMTEFSLESKKGEGVKITMQKRIGQEPPKSCATEDGEGVDA